MEINTALTKFNESVGYEKYFILNALRECNNFHLYYDKGTLIFKDHVSSDRLMNVKDSFNNNLIPNYISKNLLPLIFVSGFKIIDMFMEYVITETEGTCPWSFSEKANLLSKLTIKTLPFGIDNDIFCKLKDIYTKFVRYRNKIMHSNWGSINLGKKEAVFNLKKEVKIKFEEIFALSSIAIDLCSLLAIEDDENIFIEIHKNHIYSSLNTLKDYIGLAKEYNTKIWQVWHINYEITSSEPNEYINVKSIEDEIEIYVKDEQSMYDYLNPKSSSVRGQKEYMYEYDYFYEVSVKTNDKEWYLTSEDLKKYLKDGTNNKVKLSDISNYLVYDSNNELSH